MHVVTGNRFADFTKVTGALPAERVIEQLIARETHLDILLGQGISDRDRKLLTHLAQANGLSVHDAVTDGERAGRAVCHKHHPQNQLISAPRAIGEDRFEADLLLDDRNEILSDHLTGCHLQGMLLIEATRQMFIAVGETQYRHLGVPDEAYVVFDRIETRFETFAFPIPTRIEQQVTSVKSDRPGRVSFTAVVEIHQVQGPVASSEVSYTIFDRAALQPREEKLAQRAVRALVSRLAHDGTAGQGTDMTAVAAGE